MRNAEVGTWNDLKTEVENWIMDGQNYGSRYLN